MANKFSRQLATPLSAESYGAGVCCGGSDAYFADLFESNGDRYVAIIADTRDDAPSVFLFVRVLRLRCYQPHTGRDRKHQRWPSQKCCCTKVQLTLL
jgi:hypothetical protein